MTDEIVNKVSSHFTSFSEPYTRIRDRADSAAIQFISKDSMNKNKELLYVCEIGGGNGNLLSNIHKYTGITNIYNIKFTRSYFSNLASESIQPIHGSAIKLRYKLTLLMSKVGDVVVICKKDVADGKKANK